MRDAAAQNLVDALRGPPGAAQRRSLAKAITLLESTRSADRADAQVMLAALLPHAGRSLRVGISGVPGVGKSTFVEAMGLWATQQGHRVAVLAVDPSSSVSGGSILGDKTRMERLAASDRAYIRPSPSGGALGGVAGATREAMLVCEAAGHGLVMVETVGIGQSEALVAGMTDAFVLLQLPNAGDDLQAIKRGVLELADLVVVNKADLDPSAAARAQAQIASALHLRPAASQHAELPQVLVTSALEGTGIDTCWDALRRFEADQRRSGQFERRRRLQNEAWMWQCIERGLQERFRCHALVQALLPGITAQVCDGELSATVAAQRLLDALG